MPPPHRLRVTIVLSTDGGKQDDVTKRPHRPHGGAVVKEVSSTVTKLSDTSSSLSASKKGGLKPSKPSSSPHNSPHSSSPHSSKRAVKERNLIESNSTNDDEDPFNISALSMSIPHAHSKDVFMEAQHKAEEEHEHKREVADHEMQVQRLHAIRLEAEKLRQIEAEHKHKQKERQAEANHRKMLERRTIVANHTDGAHNAALQRKANYIHEHFAHEKEVDFARHWLVAINRAFIVTKFNKMCNERVVEARRQHTVDLNIRLIQGRAKLYVSRASERAVRTKKRGTKR